VIPPAAVLGVLALLAACSPSAAPPAAPPAVYVTPVLNDQATTQRVLFASVQPRVQTELAFRVGGRVVARPVEVGQAVRAGQVLARLDLDDLELALQAAQDQQRAARVDAQQAASDAARLARLRLDGMAGVADAERQQARAEAAAARLAQAERQVALAGNRRGHAVLTAPFDGVVTALRLEAGQTVAEGQPVLTLARPGELELQADVPEALAPLLAQWQASARVALRDHAGASPQLPLRLRELAPAAAEATRTFRARYAFVDPGAAGGLRMGATAELHLADPAGHAGAVLPVTALLATPAATVVPASAAAPGAPATARVWQVDPLHGTLTQRTVQLLSQGSDQVRVAGLPDGALVVSAGAQKLDAGMTVRPVARPLGGLLPAAPRPLSAALVPAASGGVQ
jgi:RND family efflux transporter MFP subunit